ncbi:MAG: acetyl-CoA carboxylase biotin carboxylase subunit [Mariprofundales bacterium]
MFHKILIANRGEIAIRVIRACKEMGIKTVAIYSEADKEAMHTRLADEAVCIGSAHVKQSYLNIPRIMAAAEISDAEAIHPGYGFLAESAAFAEICIESGYAWIGPSPQAMRTMGNKVSAKKAMEIAGVPLIPGSDGAVATVKEAIGIARTCGFPVIIKAASGGGGRGMKVVHSEPALAGAFAVAQAESAAAFGDDTVYIEKFLECPRHIEVQILGDSHGNVVHLFERECSMQRKNQKVIEEAPCPILDEKSRAEICAVGVNAASAVDYCGAGTIEFLFTADGSFYFIEMNTRIQVEHTVTEYITGIDLVRWQIAVAAGEALTIKQDDIHWQGHAIECRINAETPFDFRPSPGCIEYYHAPGGRNVRVDSAIYSGYCIPPYYDSMIAKIIAYGDNREEAIHVMQRALDEIIISGVECNVALHHALLANADFRQHNIHIHFLEAWLAQTHAA